MRHRSTRRGERLTADAGVAKQVEERRIGLVGNLRAQPVPHRRHVGEESQMAERGALRREARLAPRQRPAFGRDGLVVVPAPAAVVVRRRNELAVGGFPIARRQRGRPHRLRFGADEAIAAIVFELAPAPAVDQPIIVPRLTNEGDKRQQLSHARLPPAHRPSRRHSRPEGARNALHARIDCPSVAAKRDAPPLRAQPHRGTSRDARLPA